MQILSIKTTDITNLKCAVLIILSTYFSFLTQAQTTEIDSLRNELRKTTSPAEHIDLQIYLSHYFASINLDSATYYAQNVVNESKALKDYENLCHGYLKYAYGYVVNPTNICMDSAILYLDSAFNIAQKHSNFHGLSNCYRFRSVIHYNNNNFKESINDIMIAFERDKIEKDSLSMAYSILNIVDIYKTSNNAQKAYSFIVDNEAIINSQKGEFIYYDILRYKGEILLTLEKYNESLKIYRYLNNTPFPSTDPRKEIAILEELAYSYYKVNNADSANFLFKKLIALTKDIPQPIAFVFLSEYLYETKDYINAKKYLIKALYFAETHNLQENRLFALSYLAKLHEIEENYVHALDYTQQYIELRDSLKLEELDHLLDKALLNKELDANIQELIKLKEEKDNMIKLNSILIALSLFSLLFLFALILYQHKSLQAFQKDFIDHSHKDAAISMQNHNALKTNIQTPHVVLASIFFSLLNALILNTLNLRLSINIELLITVILTALSFFFAENYIKYRKNKKDTISNKRAFVIRSATAIALICLVSLFNSLILQKTLNTNSIYLGLSIITSYSISLSTILFIQYRINFTQLNNSIKESFNKQLKEKQSKPISSETNTPAPDHKITVDNMGKTIEIDINTILYVVSENVYQEFVCFNNNQITKTLVRNTMSTIEKSLTEFPGFFRCHRSYIANTSKVISIEGNTRQYYFIMEHTSEKVPISRTAAKNLAKDFTDFRK